MIIYDVTDQESFYNMNFWLDIVRENADEQAVILIVPNKSDVMIEHPERREIKRDMVQDYAKRNKVIFVDEVSAKLDINVAETFEFLINLVHQTQLSLVQQDKKTLKSLKLTYEQE